ncbi:hypothetical protein HJG60_008888 [Phyllostomus discolor]|uniref:Uncharacterized protein n=1 Tax=Phyllostomus discolor TaxID=89673 RepID=A0A833YSR7_9CHIR|nr:hypothetical protein HJG60_008888 [Phyllostomus discolor]
MALGSGGCTRGRGAGLLPADEPHLRAVSEPSQAEKHPGTLLSFLPASPGPFQAQTVKNKTYLGMFFGLHFLQTGASPCIVPTPRSSSSMGGRKLTTEGRKSGLGRQPGSLYVTHGTEAGEAG